jgi:protein TonB
MDSSAASRLAVALAVSAALHLSLLATVQVGAPEPGQPVLRARLQPSPAQATLTDPLVPGAVVHERNTERGRHSDRTRAASVPALQRRPAAAAPQPAPAIPPGPAAMPLVADPTWYPALQLDVVPRPITPLPAVYPPPVGAEPVRGEVTLLLLVDETGTVHELSVMEAQPQGYFEAAALDAFRGARFEPARKDGRAVRSRVLVRMAFEPGPPAAGAEAALEDGSGLR